MVESEFSEDALKKLFYDIKKLSAFSAEESAALCLYIPMTEEIFIKCLKISFKNRDREMIGYLVDIFPEFAEKIEIENLLD